MEKEIVKHPKAGLSPTKQRESVGEFLYLSPAVINADFSVNWRGRTLQELLVDPKIHELGAQIAKHGIRNPLRGYFDPERCIEDGRRIFHINNGFSRYAAYLWAKEQGLIGEDFLFPVMPDNIKTLTEEDLIVLQVVDNTQQEWSPIAKAKAYLRLSESGLTGNEIAKMILGEKGETAHIHYYLKVAQNPELFEKVISGEITFAVANSLLQSNDPIKTLEKIQESGENKITGAAVKNFIQAQQPTPRPSEPVEVPAKKPDNGSQFYKGGGDPHEPPARKAPKEPEYDFWDQISIANSDADPGSMQQKILELMVDFHVGKFDSVRMLEALDLLVQSKGL